MTTLSSTQSNSHGDGSATAAPADYDVAIIGSGLGGLECAHILASQGRRVIVLERWRQPGGCTQGYRRGGYIFDTGMHYVGGLDVGQPLHDAFNELGLLRLPWVRLDAGGFDRVTIGRQSFRLAQGYDRFVDVLAADFPAEREALERYVAAVRLSDNVGDAQMSRQMMETSAWEWLTQNFSDELLVNVVSGASMKLELRKESLPLFTFLHCNGGYISSAWRLRGDGGQIADSLVGDIRRMGGAIVCGAEVVELVEDDGRIVEAVCKDGRHVRAAMFISDVHPAVTMQWLHGSRMARSVYRRRMAMLPDTFGMFTVSVVLKPHTVRYFNHNEYVYRAADVWDFYTKKGPVGGLMVSCRVPEDANIDASGNITDSELYATQIDILTPMLWSEVAQWESTSVGRRGDDYKSMKQRRAEECIELASTVVKGLSGAVKEIYTSTPLTYRDYTNTPYGSAFGIRKDYSNALMTQLSVRTPVPNLMLTGQSLILHGLQGVTMTALATVGEISKQYNNR